MRKELLSIGELSKLTNINIKSLRYYDSIGVLVPAYIAESGYRYYSPAQIVLVDAIQLCVDLGIPLKNFYRYYDRETGALHYNRLFEDGTKLAEIKIRQIKQRLEHFAWKQEEMLRCGRVLNAGSAMPCVLPEIDLWIRPYRKYASKAEQLLSFCPEIHSLEHYGVIAGYDTGRLVISSGGQEELYIYIILENSGDFDLPGEKFIHLPQSEYLCIKAGKKDILNYNILFPQYKDKDKIIIEAELVTENYITGHPEYELRCLLT